MQSINEMFGKFVYNSPKYIDDNENTAFQVLLSYLLGIGFGVGLMLFFYSPTLYDLGIVMVFISFFHTWEYHYVAIFRPKELTAHSFLLNHSNEFTYAFLLAFTEYFIEYYYFPNMKRNRLFVYLGIIVMFVGQSIRTVAMYQCGANFNHQIEHSQREDHELVTTGIYQYLRHPSYFGWFYWAISIQVTLMNPISFCAWSYAAFIFFQGRIRYEEGTLKEMFKEKYEDYQKRVPVGIPFIK